MLSTITPSTFLEICLLHGDYSDWPQLSKADREEEVSQYQRRFEVLRELHKVRGFRLVLCAGVWGRAGEEPVRMLEGAIAEEKAKGGFDEFPCQPSVVYNPQEFPLGRYRSFVSF